MSTTANQQFEGDTLEDALEAAVASFGDQLEVIDAQRVRRRGLLGIRRRERYEVTATNRAVATVSRSAATAVSAAGFDDVLRRMVDRVDDAERSVGADLADTDKSWWSEADFVVPADEIAQRPVPRVHAQPAADIEVDVRLEPARASASHPSLAEQAQRMAAHAHSVFEDPARSDMPGDPGLSIPAPPHEAIAPVADPSPPDASPAWSSEALLSLELPPALIGRLRPDELHDDLEWVSALSRAIGELLETASHMSGPCELTGHGAASAVHLVRGACDGFRLDSLIIDGRRVAATPLELALAIRSLLPVRTHTAPQPEPAGVMALVDTQLGVGQ